MCAHAYAWDYIWELVWSEHRGRLHASTHAHSHTHTHTLACSLLGWSLLQMFMILTKLIQLACFTGFRKIYKTWRQGQGQRRKSGELSGRHFMSPWLDLHTCLCVCSRPVSICLYVRAIKVCFSVLAPSLIAWMDVFIRQINQGFDVCKRKTYSIYSRLSWSYFILKRKRRLQSAVFNNRKHVFILSQERSVTPVNCTSVLQLRYVESTHQCSVVNQPSGHLCEGQRFESTFLLLHHL